MDCAVCKTIALSSYPVKFLGQIVLLVSRFNSDNIWYYGVLFAVGITVGFKSQDSRLKIQDSRFNHMK